MFHNYLLLPGTNGAISTVGILSSIVGGFMVGCGFYIGLLISFSSPVFKTSTPQWPVIFFAAIAGLVGSLIDSLLGALFQYSGLRNLFCCWLTETLIRDRKLQTFIWTRTFWVGLVKKWSRNFVHNSSTLVPCNAEGTVQKSPVKSKFEGFPKGEMPSFQYTG